LPLFSSTDPAEIARHVLEERRRELFLDGHRLGDFLRLELRFDTGLNHKRQPYGDVTCMPLPLVETANNPNISN
jgi:hypothetical protein